MANTDVAVPPIVAPLPSTPNAEVKPNLLARASKALKSSKDKLLPKSDTKFDGDTDHHERLYGWVDAINICDDLDDQLLSAIGSQVKREFDIDEESRSKWVERSKKAMDLAMQVAETKQYPWPGASNVIYPLMTSASIQFAARAYPAIVNNKNVVKGVVVGRDDGEVMMAPDGSPAIQAGPNGPLLDAKGQPQPVWQTPPGAKRARADNIGEHMSWQLLDEQPEWEEETDKLLHMLPIVGCMFRKSFFDKAKGRNASLLVSSMDVCINYHAKSVPTAPRVTEIARLYPIEIKEYERAGLFRKITYSNAPENANDEDAPHTFLEQHRLLDLDEDDFPEPYIVTVHKDTQSVVRIVARYDADGVKINSVTGEVMKIIPVEYYTKYDFLPNPEGGIYGVGFGQLLYPINVATNTTLNMLIDSGHLANTGGGFIGKGLSMHSGNLRFTPGEYKSVNVPGATVRDSIVPLVFPPPSMVLFQLLGMLVEAGKEIAAVKDVLTGEQKDANIPATTTLALIEQGLKVFTAIYKRIYRSLKMELKKLYRLNRLYLDEEAGYNVGDEWRSISRKDYEKGSGVEPVSDPSMVSDMQMLGRAAFLQTFANDPWFNGREVRRRVLDAARIDKVDELLLQSPPIDPEIIKDDEKLRQAQQRITAEAVKDLSQAVYFLAQADVAMGEAKLPALEQQMARLGVIMEQMHAAGNQAQPGAGGGPVGGELSPMAAPPGNANPLPIPA